MPGIVHLIVPEGPRRGARPVYRPVLPRGALQVARAAEDAGWNASVLDGYSRPEILSPYLQKLEAADTFPADLIAVAVHGPPALEPALSLVERIRAMKPSIPLLFGGQFGNADPNSLLPFLPERSVLFSGDGDAAIGEVLEEALQAEGEPRLVRRKSVTPWSSLPDLDLLLPDLSYYLTQPDFEYHLETQIGCPWRCFHCGTGRLGLYARTRNRPIEAIDQELDRLVKHARKRGLELPQLWITDETFASDPAHATAFCEMMAGRPEPWSWRAQSRADVVREDLIQKMREAGCRRLAFGVEIPNDAGLDLLGKREAMSDVEQAFATCRRQGISPEAIIVLATPDDRTRPGEFLEALDHLGAGSVQAYIYHPIPGSPWWRKFGENLFNGSSSLARWSRLDFHSPPLDASPTDIEKAIVAFLSLHMWRPVVERRPADSSAPAEGRDFRCHGCGIRCRPETLLHHEQTGIEVLKHSSNGRIYYVASTPGESQVLELDSKNHQNLYTKTIPVPPRDDGPKLCPACCFQSSKDPHTPLQEGGSAFLAI